MLKAVVFDMDGILFDTERLSMESWREIAAEEGMGNIEEGVYGCIGLNRTDCCILLKQVYGQDFPYEDFRVRTAARFDEKVERYGIPVMKGVREILAYLKGTDIKLAVASSTRYEKVVHQLCATGIYDYFQLVIGGDMVEHSKPQPDIYMKACEMIHIAPADAIAIEDSPNGIRSAHAAGMKAVMVPDMVMPTAELEELLYWKCDTLLEVMEKIKEVI